MHKFNSKVAEILVNILEHTIWRLNQEPSLDYPRTVDFFKKNAQTMIREQGNSHKKVFAQFKEVLEKSIISVDSPRFLSFIPVAPTKAAMIFDLVVSAGSLCGVSWQEASGAVWAENQVIRWIADLANFPKKAGGCFVSGGTNANLSALVVAREKYRQNNNTKGKCLAIICSSETHSSIANIAMIMDCALIIVPAAKNYQLNANTIENVINNNKQKYKNYAIFAVVATAGTTNLGVIDDIMSIIEFTKKINAWLHVDAAYGGGGLLSSKVRHLYQGIEQADSFIIDPHKWLFAPLDCAAVIYRNKYDAQKVHVQKASYLNILHEDDSGDNPADYAIHLSRRARGLPLWFSLSVYGVAAYRKAIEKSLENAQYAAKKIQTLPYLHLLMKPILSIVVFKRIGWNRQQYKKWSTQQLKNQLCFVTPSEVDNSSVLRLAFLNPETNNKIINDILLSLKN